MSLFDYLNNDLSSSSSASSSTSSQIAQARQALADKLASVSSSGSTTGSTASSVLITVQARRAAAAKADAGKDASALANELRASLDAQYKAAGRKDTADLTTLSGRALSTIALNDSGQFSKTEIAAAKLELRTRDRQSAIAAIASGPLTAKTLATYSSDLLAARESMSAEEQRLRQSDPSLR